MENPLLRQNRSTADHLRWRTWECVGTGQGGGEGREQHWVPGGWGGMWKERCGPSLSAKWINIHLGDILMEVSLSNVFIGVN